VILAPQIVVIVLPLVEMVLATRARLVMNALEIADSAYLLMLDPEPLLQVVSWVDVILGAPVAF
jgi:hypothetical protein